MRQDWQTLTQMTQERDFLVKKVQIETNGTQIEGTFELPPLAKLKMEDQVFMAAFIKSHGSIKEMERLFGVSYPTIKSRLSKLGEKLSFVQAEMPPTQKSILDKLNHGEISVEEALYKLKTHSLKEK